MKGKARREERSGLWEVLTRREDEEMTQSQISTGILKCTTIIFDIARPGRGARGVMMKVQGVGVSMWGARAWGLGFGIQDLGLRVPSFGFRVKG